MHPALSISEVFDCIVDCFAGDTMPYPMIGVLVRSAADTNQTGRQALAALASTCRAFSEPALDALWRRLHSLQPLMLCVPTKASYEDTSLDAALPPFNEQEWCIVLRYASRVQELTLEYDDLSVKILQSLWFRTTLLLPNLRELRWVYGDHTAVASIRLLLSPSLVHLYMWLEDGDHTSILAFLESYYTLCPNLKSLHLEHSGRFPHVTAAISRAIPRSPNLETLGCGYIDEAALVHVAASHCLKRFSATLLDYEPDDLKRLAGYGVPNCFPFENLRILQIHVKDLSSIIPYLKPQHQPFEEVSVKFDTDCPSEVFHEFFAALSSTARRRTLRSITLSVFRSTGGAGIFIPPIDFQVLSPLTTFNLHELHINTRNVISLNDDELVRLVQGWPELRIFHLNADNKKDYLPSHQFPTLKGLLLLLARCPKLCGLGLSVDAMSIPSLSQDESLIRNSIITTLSVVNSPIQEPARVAHFLLEHLPSLRSVPVRPVFPLNGRSDWQWQWRKVEREIRKILGLPQSPEWSDGEIDIDI